MNRAIDDEQINENENEEEDEDEDDDPFSMAVKELEETNRQADEIARVCRLFSNIHQVFCFNLHFQQRSLESTKPQLPVFTPQPAPPPPPPQITITRPIILHGLHAPVQNSPIIRLQRPVTIPSGLFTLPTNVQTQLPTSASTGVLHQFIPALRPMINVMNLLLLLFFL